MNTRDQKSIPAATEAGNGQGEMLDSQIFEPQPAVATMTAIELDDIQLEVADYILSICTELRAMAQTAELDGLAYFIDMVRFEASARIESHKDIGPT